MQTGVDLQIAVPKRGDLAFCNWPTAGHCAKYLISQGAKCPDERHVLCVALVQRTGVGRLHSNGHFAVQPFAAPGNQRGHTRAGAAKAVNVKS